MLIATQAIGFGAGGKTVQTLIPRTDGTAIGNMTENGGLAAAFDGITDQSQANSARITGALGLIGKDWGAGVTHRVSGFKAWGANNSGYCEGSNPTVNITLEGSSDNFGADINDLGTISFTDTAGSTPVEKLSGIDTSTAYRYHRLKIDTTTCGVKTACAECQFFEDLEG